MILFSSSKHLSAIAEELGHCSSESESEELMPVQLMPNITSTPAPRSSVWKELEQSLVDV